MYLEASGTVDLDEVPNASDYNHQYYYQYDQLTDKMKKIVNQMESCMDDPARGYK